jgi:hypothetical protein
MRPRITDTNVINEAITKILPKVNLWVFQSSSDRVTYDIGENTRNLVDLIESNINDMDGYKLCKYLEDEEGWEPDTELVLILNELEDIFCEVHEEKVREWVLKENIKLTIPHGSFVKVISTNRYKNSICTINGCNADTARYSINVKGYGEIEVPAEAVELVSLPDSIPDASGNSTDES